MSMGPRNTAPESFQGPRATDGQSTDVSGRGPRNNGWCWQKIILDEGRPTPGHAFRYKEGSRQSPPGQRYRGKEHID